MLWKVEIKFFFNFCDKNKSNLKTLQRIFEEKHLEHFGAKLKLNYKKSHVFEKEASDSVANWIFSGKSHLLKIKSQMGTFHEVLPGNLVFFHFYYIRTKELEYLDHTTELYVKSYNSKWNCTYGG